MKKTVSLLQSIADVSILFTSLHSLSYLAVSRISALQSWKFIHDTFDMLSLFLLVGNLILTGLLFASSRT